MGGLGCGPCRGGEELATSTAPASMRYMHLGMGHDPAHAHYKGNTTSTAKYNAFTFLPKCLFEQYRCAKTVDSTLWAGLRWRSH